MQETLPYQLPFTRSIGPYCLQRVVLINRKLLCWLEIKFINSINNPFLDLYTSGYFARHGKYQNNIWNKNGDTIKLANDV